MSLFQKLGTEGLEESKDYMPSSGPIDSDIYAGKIKVAYAGKSTTSDAQSVTVLVDFNGREYRETFWVTDSKGQNYYTKDGKKYGLPGFNIVDAICIMATDKPLSEQDGEEKIVKIYDFEAKAELNKSVPVLTELTDQPVALAIIKILENKSKKGDDGKYKDIAEERYINQVDSVFHPEMKCTLAEAREAEKSGNPLKAEYWDKWSKRNKEQVRDRRTIKDGAQGQSGRPPASSKAPASAPQAGTAAPARKSLFGAKS